MVRTGDGITGYVAGGLGNQLFILGAAWEQARRLGCPLYLDASSFAVNKLHPYGLTPLDVPAQLLASGESPWRTVRVPTGRHLPIPRRPPGHVFLERSVAHYSSAIDRVRPGTTLVGYFQSARYFPHVRDELLAALAGAPETAEESAILAELASRPAITLHLRRGDYLLAPDDKVFLATVGYALRAVALLRRTGMDHRVRVFTDSVDLVRDELSGVGEEFEFVEKDVPLGTVATLKAMASGEAMIMSNSSFSWWAAMLLRRRAGADRLVIAPRPWTGSGESRADLLEPDWVTLDAR